MSRLYHQKIALQFFLSLYFVTTVNGTSKCVWVRGALQCNRDPKKHQNVEIRVIDRDGRGPLKIFDPDDLMGVTFTEQDGTFQLDGCGSDMNFIPGVPNYPDPFIRIVHYCNSEQGETIELPKFRTFVPDTYDLGILVLDKKTHSNSSVTFPVPEKLRRRLQVKRPSVVGVSTSEESKSKEHQSGDGFVTVDMPMSHNSRKGEDDQLPSVAKTETKPNEEALWEGKSLELVDDAPDEYDTSTKQSQQKWEESKNSEDGERKNWTKQKHSAVGGREQK